MVPGTSIRWSALLNSSRVTCGTARPINPTGPQKAVTVPVSSAVETKMNVRERLMFIYGMKEGESPWLLAALLLLLIGPAEEIFWRGYVQRTLSKRWNPNAGFVVATLIYALVHAGSCNFMLVMAALVVGAAWGALYRFFPNRFAAIILSHAVWDVAVFIFFPI